MQKLKIPNDNRGMSLVEILVAVGIMGILMLAFSQMAVNQQRETRALSEKIAALDTENLIGKVMAAGTGCSFTIAGPAASSNPSNPQRFVDTTPAPIAPQSLQRIYSNNSGLADSILAEVGQRLGGSTLTVSAITLGKIQRMSTGNYRAEFQISTTNGVRALKPLIASIVFQTDSGAMNPGFETVTACGSSSSPIRYWTNNVSLALGQVYSVPHGFSTIPHYRASLVKVSGATEGVYDVGAEIGIESFWQWPLSEQRPFTIAVDNTNITVRASPSYSNLYAQGVSIIGTNWRLKIIAYSGE